MLKRVNDVLCGTFLYKLFFLFIDIGQDSIYNIYNMKMRIKKRVKPRFKLTWGYYIV